MKFLPLLLVSAMCLWVAPLHARLTGYSMGGFGTFDLVAREPKLFAAAVPVAGGGNPATAGEMKRVPFWVFHGDADTVVGVEQSRKMVEALIVLIGKDHLTDRKPRWPTS